MTAFTVWRFETLDGAREAANLLKAAADDNVIRLDDLAVVVWPVGEEQPKIDHGGSPGRRGAAFGGAGGLFLGMAFAIPLVGLAAGAALGASANKYMKAGISEDQLEKIRGQLKEGDSALFAMTEGADLDRVCERFRGVSWKLIDTNLTDAERDTLYETFGGE
jgi:uncharacterized membrane protein